MKSLQLIAIFVVITTLSCTTSGSRDNGSSGGTGPQVIISSPNTTQFQEFELGNEVQIQSTSIDAAGVSRVELVVDNQIIRVDANPKPISPYIVVQSWIPQSLGSHTIQVRAYNVDNLPGQSKPFIIEVVQVAQVAEVTATVVPIVELPTATAVPIVELPPTATAMPPTPVPSLTPITKPTIEPPERTATAEASPTMTNSPTPTPTPGNFTATGIEPTGGFKEIWQQVGGGNSRLGYPLAPQINDRNFARQYFKPGLMYWWDNPNGSNYIWVIDSAATDFKSGATSNRYIDSWSDNDSLFSCDIAQTNGSPERGFGKVWCDHPELQTRLGYPRELERGSDGIPPYSQVQFFQGGVIVLNPLDREVFVLFAQGDWVMFEY